MSAAFLDLARYRTRENLKPQAARCGFLLWLAPLALMQKSLRHKGDIFTYGCGIWCAREGSFPNNLSR
jgi:hypothetical protein